MSDNVASVVDFTIQDNAYWDDSLQFGTPGDVSWSFSGVTFTLSLKVNPLDTAAVLTVSTAGGTIVVDDPVNRILHMFVPNTTLAAALFHEGAPMPVGFTPPAGTSSPFNANGITNGVYFYDMIMTTTGTGQRDVLMQGKVNVEPGCA